ncbi:hypothetical protein PTKIN_Ptkin02bG0208700 [Pterospermum kingtungense]
MDDRFSALSEQLSYRILSFLRIEDLGRLLFVSRRCKWLCLSVPCLTIDNTNFMHDLISRQFFILFVDNFLALRQNYGTKTQQLTFFWSFRGSRCDQRKKRKKWDTTPDPEESLVAQWLKQVSYSGAERLYISLVPQEGRRNFFPCQVLWPKSLKDLSFCSNGYVMEFPYSFDRVYPLNLESLTLQSAQILISTRYSIHIPAISEIHSLKSLCLYDCSGQKILCIESSSLKLLKIINEKPADLRRLEIKAPKLEKFFLTWYPADPRQSAVYITCSALQEFVWYGYPVPLFSPEGKRSHLQFAAIYFTIPPGLEVETFSKYNVKHLPPRLESSAEFLRLNSETIQIFLKHAHLTAKLDAMRNLAIDYCLLTDEQVPIIASFLKKISCLETFFLTSSPTMDRGSCKDEKLNVAVPAKGFGFNVEYWEMQKLKFIGQLKKATVEVHREKGNDLELVKYMLKHAKGLEYLTIVCVPSLASSIQESLTEFIKASTKLIFCFKPQVDELAAINIGLELAPFNNLKNIAVESDSLVQFKRCSYILNFMHNPISGKLFSSFVDNFMFSRANSGIKTQQFTLVWSFREMYGGAERLFISLVPREGRPNISPGYVVWSKSVKEITFCSNDCVLEFPENLFPLGLPVLESLTLQSTRISVDFFDMALSAITSLKSLYLYDRRGPRTICVEGSSLKQLKIINEKPIRPLRP